MRRPMVFGRFSRSLASLAFLLALGALFALPAQAEISGSCKASINGTDVGAISSENVGQAVVVKEGAPASVTLDSSTRMSELQIFIEAAGVRIPAVTRSVSGMSVRETVPVDQYARYGVVLPSAFSLFRP